MSRRDKTLLDRAAGPPALWCTRKGCTDVALFRPVVTAPARDAAFDESSNVTSELNLDVCAEHRRVMEAEFADPALTILTEDMQRLVATLVERAGKMPPDFARAQLRWRELRKVAQA